MDYLKDYIEVKDRIKLFYDKYPNGRLTFQFKGTLELNNETYIYGEAFAYPDHDKMTYCTGWAWERVPAKGFARGAEMMTLETSAWGRAIAAMGIAVTKGIASKEEVARMKPENDPWETPRESVKAQISASKAGSVVGMPDVPVIQSESGYSSRSAYASDKQVNYLYSLFKKSYHADTVNHGDLLEFLSAYSKTQITRVKEIDYKIVKGLLDNHTLLSEAIEAWVNGGADMLTKGDRDAELWSATSF